MADVGLLWKNGVADLAITNGVDQLGSELETNILVSLFTDARDVNGVQEKRGYWGADIGSLIWTLFRENATRENLQRVINYCRESLQWFIDEGIASNIDVSGTILNLNGFHIIIKFSRGSNKKYDYLFDGLTKREYPFDQSTIIINYDL